MSTVLGSFKTEYFTVWIEGAYTAADPYASAYATPVVFSGRFMSGGQLSRDNEGAQFVPSTTIVTKYASLKKGDRVAIGKFTDAAPVATAETIRKVQKGSPLLGTTDYKVLT